LNAERATRSSRSKREVESGGRPLLTQAAKSIATTPSGTEKPTTVSVGPESGSPTNRIRAVSSSPAPERRPTIRAAAMPRSVESRTHWYAFPAPSTASNGDPAVAR